MSLIAATAITKHVGARVLFQEAGFTIDEGARIGLIGANGTGKTTLLRILLGTTDHDGTISRKKGLRMATSEQDPRFTEASTVREALLAAVPRLTDLERQIADLHEALSHPGADVERLLAQTGELETEFEHLGGYAVEHRADRILEGIGFSKERHADPVEALSGGERSRLAFARLLLVEPELWLLDEPTNHLDLAGILFLERFLAESSASAIVVSHDRHFLDSVTTETWEIEGERIWRYPAPYTRARTLRDERLKAARRAYETQAEYVAHQQAFIDRYRAGQRARQAQGRLKRLERLERLERPEEQMQVSCMEFPLGERPGRHILALKEISAGYGETTLFQNLSLELERGETLGIVGPNGAGKTTFLRLLLGEASPLAGEIRWGERVQPALLSQHETFPDEVTTPFHVVRSAAPRRTEQQLRNVLGAMLFRGDDVDKPVSVLSGGERKRLMLTRLLLQGHNMLLLDEPTNHLDLPSRETLELALSTYEGTLIIVSHDRYLLDRLADRVLWIEGGQWHVTSGGFEEALEAQRRRSAAAEKVRLDAVRPPATPARPKQNARTAPAAASPYARLKTEEIEARIVSCEGRLRELNEQFADPTVFRNPERLRDVQTKLNEAREELTGLESEYATRSY